MKILREGKMKKPVTFECAACECEFIAGEGEYKYMYNPFSGIMTCESQCPNCKRVVLYLEKENYLD